MGFGSEIIGQLGGFVIALLNLFSSFISFLLGTIGLAFSGVIYSSFAPEGILGPTVLVFTLGMTFALGMAAFAFVKGVSDITGAS